MARTKLLAILAIGIGVLAPLLVAEAVLRFLPVRSGLQTLPVNEQDPVMRFAPNRPFTHSKGWDLKLVNHGRTNNFGFVNEYDYDSTARSPLLAVVGDSYVEALMVPSSETLHGRLSRCVDRGGRVYSFGVSGAPLSQYLAEARFARTKFRPDAMVVVIVGNDFDANFEVGPGTHYFKEESDRLVLQRDDYSPSLSRRLMRQSALVRYLTLNLSGGVARVKRLLRGAPPADSWYVGNTAASYTPERLEKSRKAVREFLITLPIYSGLAPDRTVLLVDGMRPDIYSEQGLKAATGSFFDVMRRYLIDEAEARGFEVIDMQPRFIQRHARDGSRFEYAADHHWNSRGHEEAAAAVASSKVFSRIFPATCLNFIAREGERVARP
jgi:hypothetical protein